MLNILTSKFTKRNSFVVEVIQNGDLIKIIAEIKYRTEIISVEASIAPLYGFRDTMALSVRMHSNYNDKSVAVNKILKEDVFSDIITENMNTLILIADSVSHAYKMLKVVRGVKGDIERKIINNVIKDYTQDKHWSIEPPEEAVITSC